MFPSASHTLQLRNLGRGRKRRDSPADALSSNDQGVDEAGGWLAAG